MATHCVFKLPMSEYILLPYFVFILNIDIGTYKPFTWNIRSVNFIVTVTEGLVLFEKKFQTKRLLWRGGGVNFTWGGLTLLFVQ